jgi:DNA-binding transcriptional MerR regulator
VRGYLRIGELSRRTGVPEATLRAWERRYGLLEPDRSPGGFRLYAEEDVDRVGAMQAHLGRGVAAADAARLALEGARRGGDAPPAQALAADLLAALEELDDVAAQAVLDRVFSLLSVEGAVRDVLLPAMAGIAAGWEDDDAVIAREHFATNLVRSRLLGLARGWDLGGGPRALLACAPEELHDLGLIAFGLALRERGWRITYLGASTPMGTIAEAAALVDPALVAVSASTPERFAGAEAALRALSAHRRLAVGGPGAGAELARRVGAEHLDGDPFAAAASI